MDAIVFLGLGKNQLDFLDYASKNYSIIGFDQKTEPDGKDYCSYFYQISILKKEEILEQVTRLKNIRIKGVISEQTDNGIETLAFLNSKLNLHGPKIRTVRRIRDKYNQRLFAKENDINQPEFFLLKDFKNLLKKKDIKSREFLIKPRIGQSSVGIKNLKNSFGSNSKLSDISNLKNWDQFLIESKCKGEDISVDGFVKNKDIFLTVICKKKKYKTNEFVDQILYGEAFKKNKERKIYKYIIKIVRDFRLNNCFFHIEIKKRNKDLFLIELTCRGGGSGLSSKMASSLYEESLSKIRFSLFYKDTKITLNMKENVLACMVFFSSKEYSKRYLNNIKSKSIEFFYDVNKECRNEMISDGTKRPEKIIFSYNSDYHGEIKKLVEKII